MHCDSKTKQLSYFRTRDARRGGVEVVLFPVSSHKNSVIPQNTLI